MGSSLVSRPKVSVRSEKDSFIMTIRLTGLCPPTAGPMASASPSVSARTASSASWEYPSGSATVL